MTFTRLTLGEPRLRTKVHGGAVEDPCSVPVVTGSQLVVIPGFETWVSHTGTSEIPEEVNRGDLALPSDTSTVVEAWDPGTRSSDWPWWQRTNGTKFDSSGAVWVVSTASPRSGSSHARVVMAGGVMPLYPTGYSHCGDLSPTGPGGTDERVFAATQGMVVDWSCWAKSDNLGQQGYLRLYLTGYDSDGVFVGFFNSGGNPTVNSLTGTYTQYTESATVPSGVVLISAQIHTSVEQLPSPTDDVTFDVDDAILSIAL